MNKSVYSLVLMDKVVEEVDKLAYSMNTSRSNLINQILAERVCCVTPENRMRTIFDYVNKLMDGMGSFKVQMQPSDSMISIRSILSYKYNPTIRYSIELYRNSHPVMGKLKVSLRTQSRHISGIRSRARRLPVILRMSPPTSPKRNRTKKRFCASCLTAFTPLPAKSSRPNRSKPSLSFARRRKPAFCRTLSPAPDAENPLSKPIILTFQAAFSAVKSASAPHRRNMRPPPAVKTKRKPSTIQGSLSLCFPLPYSPPCAIRFMPSSNESLLLSCRTTHCGISPPCAKNISSVIWSGIFPRLISTTASARRFDFSNIFLEGFL